MPIPLLATKLHVPPRRRSLVRRLHLLERLDRGLGQKLTLVSAPAGFGKTTLVAEWVHGLQSTGSPPVRLAWVSLDPGDDDPARFLAYLSAALQRAESDVGPGSFDMQDLAGTLALQPRVIDLINQAADHPDELLLVLDDYHLIASQKIHEAVGFLVEHLPANMHLVLATRGDPPLPLARLRARGELTELRQSDLRFTTQEVAAFLNDVAGLDLSPTEVASLERRTEGWIAGLRMASLAVEGWKRDGATDVSGSIRQFTGSHRFILDYLMEEVLDQQSLAVQEFLLQTSILDALTGPLCDAVRFGPAELDRIVFDVVDGKTVESNVQPEPVEEVQEELRVRPPSQQILEYLADANLFIVPLDEERRWYRYHRLFSDLLRKRLQQSQRDLVRTLHRRASYWHEAHGSEAAAIDHALGAEDYDRAANLIEDSVEATFGRSELVTILRWVERLPDAVVRNHPTLSFYHAWALLMSGRSLDAVERDLVDITEEQDGPPMDEVMRGRIAALRAYGLLLQADMAGAADMCAKAMDTLPESDRFLRSIVAWVSCLARVFGGGIQDSSQELGDLASMGQALGNPLIAVTALCFQARLQARQGRLFRAREILERALQLAADEQGQRLPIASEAMVALGDLYREWNDLDTAADYLAEAIELAAQWSEVAALDAYGSLARTRAAQGDWQGAEEALEIARDLARKSEFTDMDDHVVDLHLGRLRVARGDLDGARRWARRRGLGLNAGGVPTPSSDRPFVEKHLRKYELEVLARLLLLAGRSAEALELLDSLLAEARDLARTDLIIDLQILRARAFQSEENDEQAMAALIEALSLAEPGGYVRIFLDEGPAMIGLLRRAATHAISQAYALQLLEAFGAAGALSQEGIRHPRPQPLLEPLSEREMEVLRLLATGMSNPEIAESLYIAVSTVRSHCKSIYAKLNVHRRWDAVQRAQELGLL